MNVITANTVTVEEVVAEVLAKVLAKVTARSRRGHSRAFHEAKLLISLLSLLSHLHLSESMCTHVAPTLPVMLEIAKNGARKCKFSC